MSRVWTKVVYEWDEQSQMYVVDEANSESYEYDGQVALCKGDQTAKQTELLQQQNMQNNMAFNQQLMGLFQQQFAKQDSISQYLQGILKPMIDNPTGYSSDALAAMKTSATDTISNQYSNAQKALQTQQFAQGGRELPSGVNEQLNSAMKVAQAGDTSGALNNITLQNENLKQTNFWNAMSGLTGQQQLLNPLGYAGAATSAANSATEAGNSVANLSQAYNASKQSGLLGGLLGGAMGMGSALLGNPGLFGGGKGGCWIAEAIFGEGDERMMVVRAYLNTVHADRWFMKLYIKFGERIAKVPAVVAALKPLFNFALVKADAWVGA